MSRRKQSNPKPLKRPEDEDDESDVASKMDQSEEGKEMETDQSDSPSHSEIEVEAEEVEKDTEVIIDRKGEIKDEDDTNEDQTDENENSHQKIDNEPKVGEMSPKRQDVMKRLKFPADLLTLRQVNESEYQETGIPWSVTSLVEIHKGTTVGSYQGETVALSSIKPGELVLQFQGSDGEFSFIKVTEERGAWLSLLRPAFNDVSHNTCVFFEGGRIWCEIVEDLEQGTELLASFTTNQNEGPAGRDSRGSDKADTPVRDVKLNIPGVKKMETKSAMGVTPQPALIYGCPFCGVRFSSRRTLEAHLTHYCSKKPADFLSVQELYQRVQQQAQAQMELQAKMEEDSDSQKSNEQTSPRSLKRPIEDQTSESAETASAMDQPKMKSPKPEDVYKCKSCNYATERLSSFQRHQAAHISESESGTEAERLSVSPACQDEMFCKECKIQFSSMSTFRGHKEFYCRYRNTTSKDGENLSEHASPGSQSQGNERTLKMLKSPTLALESQLLAAKGQLHPALIAANPAMLHSPLFLQEFLAKTQQQGELTKALNKSPLNHTTPVAVSMVTKSPTENDDQPLDLSKSSKESSSDTTKAIDFNGEVSVKSEPRSSPEQLSPSAKKIKLTDERLPESASSGPKTPLNIPSLHPSILMAGPVQYVNKKPIPPLQSVSRCVECNIVFYKRENYLIHKEHYCSGRRNKDSSSSDSDNQDGDQKDAESLPKPAADVIIASNPKVEKNPKTDILEPKGQNDSATNNDVYLKFFCIPCKIKFSSAGTLNAHKEYYCPHGKSSIKNSDKENETDSSDHGENSMYRCENCKNDFTSARLLKLHICMGELSPTPLLRCLYCDYVTQTENRLSEHMKVHIPTKAFKCNICGYRGNTARGMRMHGKMHMENGEEFTDENMVEYEEPPLVPIQRNGVCDKGPIDMETELIRMKNEPYKRRRSRKSFEKSENMVPFLGQICAACGQSFTNVSDFVIHLRMHEIAALEAMKSLRCEHCTDFVAESLTSLLIHMQTKHPEQLPGTSKNNLEKSSEGERSRSCDSHVSNDRSRSCSVESSKTNHSSSSHDNKAVHVSAPNKSVEHQQNGDSITAGYVEVKIEKDQSDTEIEYKLASDESNSLKSPKSNDLPYSIKSLHSINTRSSMEEPRSKTEELKSGSPQRHSPKTGSPQNLEPVKSPQQETSPAEVIKCEPKSPSSSSPQDYLSHVNSSKESSLSPTNDMKKREAKLSPKLTSPDPKTRYLMNIKQEQMSPPAAHTPTKKSPPPTSPRTQISSPQSRTPISSPKLPLSLGSHSPTLPNIPLLYSPHALLTPYQFAAAGIPLPLIPGMAIMASSPGQTSPVERAGRKYCKHCDINFTYLSSFLTHKKYYCSARNNTEGAESPTATA